MTKLNNHILLSLLTILTILFSYLSTEILVIDELVLNSLREILTNQQIQNVLELNAGFKWLNFILIPIILLIKTSIIAAILDVGYFFFGRETKYKKLFNIVLKAEFVFLLVILLKTTWFYFFKTDYNLEDLQYFYPLSALNIIGYEGLQPWFIYPFQTLNLFELAYWFILAYLIGKELNENTDKGMAIVASSYGVALLIWVVGVMFLNLNMS